jgi:outer membrane protein assembly factor BamD
MKLKFVLLFLLLAITFSCQHQKPDNSLFSLYHQAYKTLQNDDFKEAGEKFEQIQESFPFSPWAIKAKTMSAYAYYRANEKAKTLQITQDFLQAYPDNQYAVYMLYLQGLCYHEKIPNIYRSQEDTFESANIFSQLIAQYPNSIYIDDAKEKLEFAYEHLTASKMAIGRYQIKNNNFVGAIGNFQSVINDYPQTSQTAEAYSRLAEIYLKLGLEKQSWQILSFSKQGL